MPKFETRLRLISETNINIKNNTSVVEVAFDFRRADYPYSGYNLTGSAYWNITVDGQSSGNVKFTFSYNLAQGQWQEVARRKFTVKHNNDGSKTISMNGYINFGSGVFPGSLSGRGSARLQKIPRASTVASVKGNLIGSPITVNFNRADAGFTHEVWYRIGNTAWKALGNGHGASVTFTPPMTDCELIKNATFETLGIKIKTFSGNTAIGNETYNYANRINIPASVVPTIDSVVITDNNKVVSDRFHAFLQALSKLHGEITASGAYGSTIAKYEVVTDGKTYLNKSFDLDSIDKSGTIPIKITVYDSRGRKAEKTENVTLLEYHTPTIAKFTAERAPDIAGADADLTIQAEITDVKGLNTTEYKIEYKEQGTEVWRQLDVKTGYTLNSVYHYTNAFNVDNSFDVRVTARDYFSSVTWSVTLPTAFVLMDFKGNGKGIAFGKVSQKDGMEIDIPAEFNKPVIFHHGEVPGSAKLLAKTLDLNTLIDPGYYIFDEAKRNSLLNFPEHASVGSGAIEVKAVGEADQINQRLTICSEKGETFGRRFYGGKWYNWVRVRSGGSRVLWQGAAHMSERDTITLAEPISLQEHGIVLVFCAYSSGQATNNDFNSHFVHKDLIKMQNDRNHAFFCTNYGLMKPVCSKLIKITDTQMKGNNQNKFTGDYGGLHLDGNFYVLRYVLGI